VIFNYSTGLTILEFALAKDLSNPDILYNLGMALSDKNELDRAIELLQRAVQLTLEFVNANVALGVALARIGKSAGLLATHAERKGLYTVAVKVEDKFADTVTRATFAAMKKLPPEKVKTMTFDNGMEVARFKELERGLGMRSYFAHPYRSWERGTNENTNGLLRQFFPKGVDFDQISQSDGEIIE
jgi:IS30 family transposase